MFIEISTHIALRWSAIHFVRGAIDMLLLWSKARESLQWRRRWRRPAMMRCLFVRIGECEQMAFVPGTAKDRQARG